MYESAVVTIPPARLKFIVHHLRLISSVKVFVKNHILSKSHQLLMRKRTVNIQLMSRGCYFVESAHAMRVKLVADETLNGISVGNACGSAIGSVGKNSFFYRFFHRLYS